MAVWDDPRVKPHVRAAAKEISQVFGITDIGGFATSGHIPDSDHYKGLAIDVMTRTQNQQVANWAIQNAGRLSITYIITLRHIWDSRNNKGWQPYVGPSAHMDHVHISFYPTPQAGSGQQYAPNGMPASDSTSSGCLGLLLGKGSNNDSGNSGASGNPPISA